MVYLDLTEDIIASFNKCIKTGNYQPFLNDNREFLDRLDENLGKVKFEKDSKYEWISKKFKFCLKYLSHFDARRPYDVVTGVRLLEMYVPEVTTDIKHGIIKKDWNDFYWKYRPDADYMISEARRQGIIDFSISFGSGIYESFELRDFAFENANEKVELLPTRPNVHSQEYSNSGAMVQANPEPEITTTPKNVTVIRVFQKSPDRDISKKNNEVKTTYYSTAKTQITTGKTEQTRLNRPSEGINLTPMDNKFEENSVHQESPHPNESVENGLRRSARIADQKKVSQKVETNSEPPKNKLDKKVIMRVYEKSGRKKEEEAERDRENSKFLEEQVYRETNLTSDNTNQKYLDDCLRDLQNKPQLNNNLSKQDSFSHVPFTHAANLKFDIEFEPRNFHIPNISNEDPFVKLRSPTRDSPEFDNSAFDQKLREQNLKNSKHLEEVKAERKKKQAKFDEELQKMRAESKKRYEILLACILMKHRFEEQEQNWKDWIQGCKNHIIQLCNRCADFVEDVNRNHGGLRKPEKVDHEELNSDKVRLLGNIMKAFNAIQFDFEHLKMIEGKYPNGLFVRVLQSCLSKTASALLNVYNSLQSLIADKKMFQEFQTLNETLTPNMIYSTSDLHRICSGYTAGKYDNIKFPEFSQTATIHEIFD